MAQAMRLLLTSNRLHPLFQFRTCHNCSRSAIVTMLSGGRSRITSAGCRSGSTFRGKRSTLSGSVGTSGGGSLMLFPPILASDAQAAQDLADRRFRDFGDKHVLAWVLKTMTHIAAEELLSRIIDSHPNYRVRHNEENPAIQPRSKSHQSLSAAPELGNHRSFRSGFPV
jgi:hypothetical protein